MKYSDTYREQLLLDAVRSAEDAAIQLRQYAAAGQQRAVHIGGDQSDGGSGGHRNQPFFSDLQ